MPTFISMLRGINVSGQKKVPMKELRNCYGSMGFREVKTYIQSGNVVFKSQNMNSAGLVRRIESEIRASFGFDVIVVNRTSEEMEQVIKHLPFTPEEAGKVHVTFLSTRPATIPWEELDRAKDEKEKFLVSRMEVYLYCPNGYGRTGLNNSFLEKRLRTSATTRNWRTVRALYDMAGS